MLEETGDLTGAVDNYFKAGKAIIVFKEHNAAVTGVDFSSDGSTLTSGSMDKTILIWKLGDSLKQH